MSENQEQPQTTDDLDAFSTEFFGQSSEEIEAEEAPTSASAEDQEEETEDNQSTDAEQDGEAGGTQESQEDEEVTEEEVDEQDEEQPAPKPKPTVQERINELVRQREEAKREGQAQLDALRQEFEEKLAALQAPKPDDPAKPVPNTDEPQPNDINDDGTPKYELGEFDPAYIRDLTRYTLTKEREAIEAQAQQRIEEQKAQEARNAMVTSWNEKVEAAVAATPDFMEKGQALLAEFNNLDPGYAEYLSTVLMSMDKGPDVLYYLSNNPDEARQIVNSGAQRATLALGRIEAKFIEEAARKTLAKPKHTKAPPPPPAQARARGSNGAFISVSPDTDDLDAFATEFFAKRK